jgi:hypothetical protein
MANRNAIHILKNTLFPSQVLPSSTYLGEPLVNLGDGIMFFSGSTSGLPTWVPAGTGNTANYFEVGSNLYDLKIRNQITHYNGLSNLVGKFLSGTTSGFVLADITSIQGVDNYVTGGTYSNGTLTLDRQNGSVTITGLSTGYTLTSSAINSALGYTPLSAYTDTYVTGGTYSNGTLTLDRQNGSVTISGLTTTDTFVTGFTYDDFNLLTISQNQGQPDLSVKIQNLLLTGLTVNNLSGGTPVYIGQGGMIIGSGGSPSASGIGDLFVHGNFYVYGTGTTINTNELYIEDPTITLNYNPSGSSTSTSVGSGIIIQDGSGIVGTNTTLQIGQLYLDTNLNSNAEYTSATGNSNRGFFTQLNDIIVRNTNNNSGAPDGKRLIAEDDILDGGTW